MSETISVNHRIAAKVSHLRSAANLSLEALASRSGVSRSMISLIERGETSPTAVVLERLAFGLGATLGDLFDPPATAGPVSRRKEQAMWTDPQSRYQRRNVSPADPSLPFRIVEVSFPAGARVAFESGERSEPLVQQVWILSGRIDLTVGSARHELREGDCLAMRLDAPTLFHNPGKTAARYAVVIGKGIRR